MFNRLRFTPARLRDSRATRASQAVPGVAAEAVGAADGAGGGQHATTPAKTESRRWRDGDSEGDKAVACSATAVPEGTAAIGGTKPGRGFMRAGGVQSATR